MNDNAELVHVFKKKIEELRKEIEVLEAQLKSKEVKLNEEQIMRDELDRQVVLLTRKIGVLENDLDDNEKRLHESKLKLEEITFTAEECERSRKQLQSRHDSDDERLYQLELLVKEATDQASESEARYEEVARKLIITENILEGTDEEYEKAERKLREITIELNSVCNSFKILEQSETQAVKNQQMFESDVGKLKKILEQAERRAQVAETELTQQQLMWNELEDTLDSEKRNHQLLSNDLQRMIEEFHKY